MNEDFCLEPIRVLHVVHIMNRGGMECRLMDLYRRINRNSIQFDFYIESGKEGVFDKEIISYGGKVFYSNKINKLQLPRFNCFRNFLLSHTEYQIIFSYNQWSGFYLKQAKKCGRSCRVAYSRTSVQTKSIKNIIKNVIKLNVNKYATHKYAVSKKAAIWLFGEKETIAGNVVVLPNAIDTQKYHFSCDERIKIREKLKLNNTFVIIHVGNIRFEKNHPFVLEIFSEVKKQIPDSRLLLVGEGVIDTLKSIAKDLCIDDSVFFLGSRNDIPELLEAGDVFVFPSFYEGFPGAVLEAETSGLPCVISDSITSEVILTDYITQLSIKTKPSIWAQKILEYRKYERKDQVEVVKSAGYDIQTLVYHIERDIKCMEMRNRNE